jgi:F420H(2)-dependent biliverdin reductase
MPQFGPSLLVERVPCPMRLTQDLDALHPDTMAFLSEFLVGLLTTNRPDGSLHVVAVGFTYDPDTRMAWSIAPQGSVKVRNIRAGSRGAFSQVEGSRWLSLEGPARIVDDPDGIAEAHRRYRVRYPGHGTPDPDRVAIAVDVQQIIGIPMRRPGP